MDITLMRILFIILFFCVKANATVYYVSNTGSDAANGLTPGTAWQYLSKVNGFTFNANDSILLKSGDSWNEQLLPPRSNLYFGSYGTGAKPMLTGFQSLSGWTNSGNVWSSTFTNSVRYQNTVLIADTMRTKGRYPNTSWLTYSSFSGKNQIIGSLTGTPNYTGGEIVLRTRNWVIDKSFITSQSGGTINFSPDAWYNIESGWGYFIQNIESVLDVQNEWCYDSLNKIIKVYSASQPVAKGSSIDTLIYLSSKDYITIAGLQIQGANLAAVQLNSSNHITFENCDFRNNGADVFKGKVSSNNFTVDNCTMYDQWNGVVFLDYNSTPDLGEHDYATITNNVVKRTGTGEGMGKSAIDAYQAITIYGDHSTISKNTIDTTGYIPIRFFGDTSIVENNVINLFCYKKQDGGAIYTFNNGTYNHKVYQRVLKNIIMNGPGTITSPSSVYAIYMDGPVQNVSVDSNTVYNCLSGGIINSATGIKFRGNNFVNNKQQQLYIVNYNPNISGGLTITGNTFYSDLAVPQFGYTPLISGEFYYIPFANLGVMDGNYYQRPPLQTELIQWYPTALPKSLATWQSVSGLDLNSYGLPYGVTSANALFKYNKTSSATTESLAGTYINAKGQSFTGSITIQPFHSEMLYKAITDIVPATSLKKVKIRKVTN